MIHALVLALAVMSPDYDLSSTASGISCSGDDCTLPSDNLAFDCNTCPCLIYQAAADSDVAACGVTVKAGNAYPEATVNTSGADLTLCGGAGVDQITIDDSTLGAGDTVAIVVDGSSTTYTEGVDFACVAVSNDVCAANLCTAVDGHASLSCSNTATPIYITPAAGVCTTTITISDGGVDGAFATDAEGVSGVVRVGADQTYPDLSLQVGSAKTGFATLNNLLLYYIDGTYVANYTDTSVRYQVPLLLYNAGSYVGNVTHFTAIGGAATTSHSAAAGDVVTYDMLEVNGELKLDGVQEDIGATCTTGDTAIDTGGATVELCYCTTTDTWYCAAMSAGPAD